MSNATPFRAWRPFAEWAAEMFGGALPPQVGFCVDAARLPGLSFGHVSRCLQMARMLGPLGCESLFIMRPYPEGMRFVRERGFATHEADETGPGALEATEQLARELRLSWLVVDLPYEETDLPRLEAMHASGIGVVLVDDWQLRFPRVGTVLNSSVRALDHRPTGAGPQRALLGPAYFIMDHTPRPRAARNRPPRVLLSFGGSDPTGLTPRVLKALLARTWDAQFTVVLGPGYGEAGEEERRAGQTPGYRVLHAPPDLYALIEQHDVLLCAGGRTMYEALALETPFLPIASAAHEAQEIKSFVSKGYAPHGLESWHPKTFVDLFTRTLRRMQTQPLRETA